MPKTSTGKLASNFRAGGGSLAAPRGVEVLARDYSALRTFETGATRNTNADKLDFRGFISPKAARRFSEYMHKHRLQPDGSMRDGDNWKKGIPIPTYIESGIRHVFELWERYEDGDLDAADEAACAVLFNVQGYLHERVKEERP